MSDPEEIVMENGDTAIIIDKDLSDEEVERIKREWLEKYRGHVNREPIRFNVSPAPIIIQTPIDISYWN